jgi:broad specificity phosphatase PhoE
MDELVIVRHAQSTGNAATEESRRGNHSLFTRELRRQKSKLWRLTEVGMSQASQTGEYIRANICQTFERYLSSPFVRTKETAVALGFPSGVWEYDELLVERNWGGIENITYPERLAVLKKLHIPLSENSMGWRPPRGESMLTLVERARLFMLKLKEQEIVGRTLVVSHGGSMQALRVILHSIGPEAYSSFINEGNRIRNCQIFHYFGKMLCDGPYLRYSHEHTMYLEPTGEWTETTCRIS